MTDIAQTKTPAEIAAGLTEAQRRAVIDGKWNIYPIVYQLVGIGLVEKSHGEASTLTPLGEAVLRTLKPSDARGPTNDLREDESLLVATVSLVDGTIGIDHSTDADWHAIYKAHLSLRDRLNERLLEKDACPFKPASTEERGPTNEEIIAEAKRISDLEWEGNEEHADFFGPLLFRLQADTSWFKPEPEVDPLVAQLVEIFRALPLYGDAGCDKLTDAEWRFVASAACEALAKRPRGWLGRPTTCDEVDMSMTPLVETVARIIDPSKWAVLDSYLADMLESGAVEPEPFKDKASMAKAQAAIAAVFDALRARQERLGPEFEAAIFADLESLYEK